MNGALFRQTWRAQRLKLVVVSIALAVGFLMPLVYARFGSQFRAVMDSGMLPAEVARFGGGDIFTLPGSIALALIDPIAILLTSVFSVGFSASAVAGERQRGKLEVALARPIWEEMSHWCPCSRFSIAGLNPRSEKRSIGEWGMPGNVLVSGAGVAGCCLAWWLDRYRYAVTLVEQAPEPRTGGYVIDFWGLGYDVAEKMGVLDELRRHDLKVQEFRIVNRVGRRISGFNQGAVQTLIKSRGMSLPRSALASALYEAVKDRVDVRFGNSVTSLEDSPRGVEVTFREGEAQTFDLASVPTASTPPCDDSALVKKRDSNAFSDTTLLRSPPTATGSVIRTHT